MSAQLRVHVCVHVYMAMVESCYRVTWGSRPFCFPKVSFSTLTFITEVCLFILKDSLNRWCKWKGGPLAETEGMSIKQAPSPPGAGATGTARAAGYRLSGHRGEVTGDGGRGQGLVSTNRAFYVMRGASSSGDLWVSSPGSGPGP